MTMREIDLDSSQHHYGQSIRTVLQGLILIGICWLAAGIQEQSKSTVELRTQMVDMTEEVRSLRAQLGDIPTLARAITKSEVRIDEHERRISNIEAHK